MRHLMLKIKVTTLDGFCRKNCLRCVTPRVTPLFQQRNNDTLIWCTIPETLLQVFYHNSVAKIRYVNVRLHTLIINMCFHENIGFSAVIRYVHYLL